MPHVKGDNKLWQVGGEEGEIQNRDSKRRIEKGGKRVSEG